MLRLRCALYNGTFQRVFDNYVKLNLAGRARTIR
jgi:hypothetical protein